MCGWVGLFKMTVVDAVATPAWRPRPNHRLVALPLAQIVNLFAVVLIMLRIVTPLLVLALLEYFYQWWKQEQDPDDHAGSPREFKNLRRPAGALAAAGGATADGDEQPEGGVEIDARGHQPHRVGGGHSVRRGEGAARSWWPKRRGWRRIRRLALENGIPVVERKELARALYKTVDVGQPAPRELWAAVSEVIRYVYQLKGMKLPEAPAA